MIVQTWTLEQLFKLRRYQPEMVDQALEEMLEQRAELRWSLVVGAYLDEEINLGKAAELLGIHRLELQDRFIAQGIPLRLGPATIEEAKAELAAIKAWDSETGKSGQI
jgi:predicted HTH domain antitoxin